MIGFLLFVSIFAQLSPYGVVGHHQPTKPHQKPHSSETAPGSSNTAAHPQVASANKASSQLLVDFPQINGLKPGSPVLVEGNIVGRVKKISSKQPQKNQPRSRRSFEVALDLDSAIFEKLALGTCALQSLPMTDSKDSRKPVVELFVPRDTVAAPKASGSATTPTKLSQLQPGDRIPGFASFEEFWRSGSQKPPKKS